MNQQERKDSTNSVEREYGSGFENRAEQRSGKTLFQLALEVEDLVEQQKLQSEGLRNPDPLHRVSSFVNALRINIENEGHSESPAYHSVVNLPIKLLSLLHFQIRKALRSPSFTSETAQNSNPSRTQCKTL